LSGKTFQAGFAFLQKKASPGNAQQANQGKLFILRDVYKDGRWSNEQHNVLTRSLQCNQEKLASQLLYRCCRARNVV
jgi:hypothetical protein